MESGTSDALYAVLERRASGWRASLHSVVDDASERVERARVGGLSYPEKITALALDVDVGRATIQRALAGVPRTPVRAATVMDGPRAQPRSTEVPTARPGSRREDEHPS